MATKGMERMKSDNRKLLMEFTESEKVCVRIEGLPADKKRIISRVNALRYSVKRFNLYHIIIVHRKGEVYLINTCLVDDL